ncbi:BRI1 kinase inhibitor 1-like [Impatiens glandulifera]|uniref:BRI1 kinase inhibitor 1-like n=1 Tax=Impatiens glandulifera TaxID=253017 RepID=UPI001FB05EC5|nr:BRI1 kinase inhibitor 1-like [Impatiens glandulifera]
MENINHIKDNPVDPHQDHHQLSKLQVIHPSPKLAPPSPPSNTSSPSHEFSFTISLHPNSAAAAAAPDKSKQPTHDFSPADEIFFQGHLLPLHLLSHLPPISPRASTNSLDNLPLPVNQTAAAAADDIKERTKSKSFSYGQPRRKVMESKERTTKSKSFSFLGIPRWRTEKKQSNNNQKNQNQNQNQNQKTGLKFDIGNVVKRYIRMMRPLILSLRGKKEKPHILRQPHSFSGNLVSCGGSRKGRMTGRRDFSSAPASMRTSPGNSGLLVPVPPTSTSDSTMEELQAAIQAAIAHCKNSISMEEKIKAK